MVTNTPIRPAAPLAAILVARVDNGTYSRLAARLNVRNLAEFIKRDARLIMASRKAA